MTQELEYTAGCVGLRFLSGFTHAPAAAGDRIVTTIARRPETAG